MKHEGWEALRAFGVRPTASIIQRLEAYEQLLREVALPYGMIAPSDEPRLRARHVLDSIRAAPLVARAAEVGRVVDLGSGAGLPGVPLAIARPDLRFVLTEVRRSRAEFLLRCVRDLDLENLTLHHGPADQLEPGFDVATARAFASAARSWRAAARLLESAGTLVYWAGASFDPSTDVPGGVRYVLFETPALAGAGPLVIMARQ